jgi:chain length determinant protein
MEEFNISEFIKYYFSLIVIVILFIILGAVGSWYYTDYIQVPMYKSQTSLVLTRAGDSTGSITQNDISLNKNLVATYREIIKSRRILSNVISNLNLDITEKELSDKVSVTSSNDTELIIISVVDKDSKLARDIANEIAKVFKEEITTIYNIENISIVDVAIKAKDAYNVNPLKQYVIGVGSGFLIGSLIITVMFYFDDSIKKPEDIEEKVGLSVLSTVPKYKGKKKRK